MKDYIVFYQFLPSDSIFWSYTRSVHVYAASKDTAIDKAKQLIAKIFPSNATTICSIHELSY